MDLAVVVTGLLYGWTDSIYGYSPFCYVSTGFPTGHGEGSSYTAVVLQTTRLASRLPEQTASLYGSAYG